MSDFLELWWTPRIFIFNKFLYAGYYLLKNCTLKRKDWEIKKKKTKCRHQGRMWNLYLKVAYWWVRERKNWFGQSSSTEEASIGQWWFDFNSTGQVLGNDVTMPKLDTWTSSQGLKSSMRSKQFYFKMSQICFLFFICSSLPHSVSASDSYKLSAVLLLPPWFCHRCWDLQVNLDFQFIWFLKWLINYFKVL